ncbi:uncharacterized protein LOC143922931 [Arctopsyche grandis]|uniref:uncharacterized protein LOC143922931 n=1 Tax=Arctopsyche grandis TaxID=121162 RepID=UPI00406D9B9E
MATSLFNIITVICGSLLAATILASPLDLANFSKSDSDLTAVPSESVSVNDTNSTAQNLYVIKAIVYEIGILTDIGENDTSSNETLSNEQIDLTFFHPDKNGSIIDLGNIPIPVQTNITGQVITGIAPVDLGSISAPQFNSINISESLLPGGVIANALQTLVPSVSINSSTDNLLNHFDSQISLDSLQNVTSNNETISSLSQLGSLFEPQPISLSNQTIFLSSVS